MKALLWCVSFGFFLLLCACAQSPEQAKMEAFYKKFDEHCRTHARSMQAEYDEQVRYDECMAYFTNLSENCPAEGCPLDNAEPYMQKSGN